MLDFRPHLGCLLSKVWHPRHGKLTGHKRNMELKLIQAALPSAHHWAKQPFLAFGALQCTCHAAGFTSRKSWSKANTRGLPNMNHELPHRNKEAHKRSLTGLSHDGIVVTQIQRRHQQSSASARVETGERRSDSISLCLYLTHRCALHHNHNL